MLSQCLDLVDLEIKGVKLELYHFAEKEFTLNKSKKYSLREPRLPMKPEGLWLSDESDYGWKLWCDDNDFGLLNYLYRCVVNMDNILHIKTVPELKDFTKQYPLKAIPGLEALSFNSLDWQRVMDEHHGIVISPYQWEVRLSVIWYYPWDCASGCIWNLEAIEKFVKVPSVHLNSRKDKL